MELVGEKTREQNTHRYRYRWRTSGVLVLAERSCRAKVAWRQHGCGSPQFALMRIVCMGFQMYKFFPSNTLTKSLGCLRKKTSTAESAGKVYISINSTDIIFHSLCSPQLSCFSMQVYRFLPLFCCATNLAACLFAVASLALIVQHTQNWEIQFRLD